ncbi:hypothetical protein D8682_08560 [Buttiauxella sp. 3AFRM03]|uniref:hypothetical protein n=1 Tax=Buttiauxella sp. 3AFRM03 TaxID=2479367 RepID=UPI000EF7FDAB|nr:hypothetical protein [Buttiauxella sp. 3AFRM03]AYN27034.1 hypothetical protein D8682_08560 [Buttiauxella sp. 3AFRM03]
MPQPASTFNNVLAGTGTTTVSGAQATITGGNTSYIGDWHGTGTLAVADTSTSSNTNLGTGGVDIAAGGIANVHTTGPFSFDNALTGSGTLNASTGGQAFSFGSGAGADFAGTVVLTSNSFMLSGSNTIALTHGTLEISNGNVTIVGDGDQNIGGLMINGGSMQFNAMAPDQTMATSRVSAGNLDVSHSGTVRINQPIPFIPSPPDTPIF